MLQGYAEFKTGLEHPQTLHEVRGNLSDAVPAFRDGAGPQFAMRSLQRTHAHHELDAIRNSNSRAAQTKNDRTDLITHNVIIALIALIAVFAAGLAFH
jgi:hypothetical protein